MVERTRYRTVLFPDVGWSRGPEEPDYIDTEWFPHDIHFPVEPHHPFDEPHYRMVQWAPAERLQLLEKQIEGMSNESAALKSILTECTSLLREVLDQLSALAGRTHTTIHSAGSTGELLLRAPLSVLVEEDEGQVLATVSEFEMVGEGETEPDAVADLKSQLGALYDDIITTPDQELGKLPRSWKRILEHLVIKDATS